MMVGAYQAEAKSDQEHWLRILVLQPPHCVALGTSFNLFVLSTINYRVIMNCKINNIYEMHKTVHTLF